MCDSRETVNRSIHETVVFPSLQTYQEYGVPGSMHI